MSFQTLRDSPAIVILAAPNRNNIKVSEQAAAYGLNFLRSEPSSVRWVCLPDVAQPKYSMFKSCISQFAATSVKGQPMASKGDNYCVRYPDIAKFAIPFSPPPVVLAWAGGEAPMETLEQIRNTLSVREVNSGGKPGLLYSASNWTDYDRVKPFKANIRAAAPIETINIKTVISTRALIASLTAVTHAIRYPAFVDHEHESAFTIGEMYDPSQTMDVDEQGHEKSVPKGPKGTYEDDLDAPLGYDSLVYQNVPQWVISYKNLPGPLTYIDGSQNLDDLPKGEGLWFPFLSFLAHYDAEAVPAFIRRYSALTFGEDIGASFETIREVAGDWGMMAKTEGGKEISHYVICLEIALQGQARPLPVFRRDKYVGCVILGAGFTLDIEGKFYRPVSEKSLRDAILTSDAHAIALKAIAGKLGNEDQKKNLLACTSMLQMRNLLIKDWVKEQDKDEILRTAGALNFGHRHWPINITSLSKAMASIRDPNFSLKTAEGSDYPIHSSMILSTDTVALVWSCFGHYAPSFRIPGGREFDLSEDMAITVENPKKGGQRTIKLVRIACRQKVLEQAIADIKETLEKKSILNPVVMPKIRASQQNMDKLFSGDAGKELLGALRDFVGISFNGKKRAGEGLEAGETQKRVKQSALEDW